MAPTLVGKISTVMIHEAMETISTNEVLEWSKAFIGDTIQKLRRTFRKLTKQNLGCNESKYGIEIGNNIKCLLICR